MTRLGQRIVVTVHVGTLDGTVRIDHLDHHALTALEHRLVGRLDTAQADVIAHLIIGMMLQIIGRDLAHETQQVAAHMVGITPHGAVDGIESPEIALVETELILLGNVIGHHARRPGTHAGVGQLPLQTLARQSQHFAHARRVETALADLAVYDHQVVTFAALHQVAAVAIEHLAPRRILHDMAQHVGLGHLLVTGIEKLQPGHAAGQDEENNDYHTLQHAHADVSGIGTAHNRAMTLAVKIRAANQTPATDTALLAMIRTTVRSTWLHESASSEKKTIWCRTTSTMT